MGWKGIGGIVETVVLVGAGEAQPGQCVVLILAGCLTAADDPKPPTAFDQARAVAEANPRDAEAQFRLGEAALADRKDEMAAAAFTACLALEPNHTKALDRRGDVNLKLGKFAEAVADFDAYLKLKPTEGPYHWRRGIALYYAGKYAEGAKQFESHKAVNPEDVENAVWHFLCVAREKGSRRRGRA